MTTEINTVIELTEDQKKNREAFRKANLYIKGIICGYAKKNGMKYESKKTPNPFFEAGWKVTSDFWADEKVITGWHILYSQLRGVKSHLGDPKKETKYEWYKKIAEDSLRLFMGDGFKMLEAFNG
jgi:hypothetical protein